MTILINHVITYIPKFGQILNEIGTGKQIVYKLIIIYKHPDTHEPLYDLNHVISLCTNLDSTNNEMEYKLISQEAFYNMILHSTTDFPIGSKPN